MQDPNLNSVEGSIVEVVVVVVVVVVVDHSKVIITYGINGEDYNPIHD